MCLKPKLEEMQLRLPALSVLGVLFPGCGGGPDVERPANAVMCPVVADIAREPISRFQPKDRPEIRQSRAEVRRKQFDARQILGKSESDARALAGRHGCVIRQMNLGEGYAYTLDARHDRINVDIEDGVVVRIRDVG
jgi:hypothetical protein